MRLYSYFKVLVRPVLRLFWLTASRCTNIRRFNGFAVRVPAHVGKLFRPFTNIQYEVEAWESVWKFGKPGQSFLDIGANIGVITVAMSKIAGSEGQVIACEPNPTSYCLLCNVLKMNHCSNTLPIQALVLDKCGTSRFFLSKVGGLGVRSSIVTNDPGSEEVILPAVTVDALLGDNVRVDYIKIDAEGSEYKILIGSERTLKRFRPLVQVEVHGQYMLQLGDTVESLFGFMEQCSYRCVNIATWSEVKADQFLSCTHCHAPDTFTHEDMAFQGYGQVIFIPTEREDIWHGLVPRECKVCQPRRGA